MWVVDDVYFVPQRDFDMKQDIWKERFEKKDSLDEDNDEMIECGECLLCERNVKLTRHHLIPRETHKNMLKKGKTRDLLNKTIPVCRLCHSAIHRFFSNTELACEYNTYEKLMEDERVFRFARWASSLSNLCRKCRLKC